MTEIRGRIVETEDSRLVIDLFDDYHEHDKLLEKEVVIEIVGD